MSVSRAGQNQSGDKIVQGSIEGGQKIASDAQRQGAAKVEESSKTAQSKGMGMINDVAKEEKAPKDKAPSEVAEAMLRPA